MAILSGEGKGRTKNGVHVKKEGQRGGNLPQGRTRPFREKEEREEKNPPATDSPISSGRGRLAGKQRPVEGSMQWRSINIPIPETSRETMGRARSTVKGGTWPRSDEKNRTILGDEQE